jgi:hypothetical protein
LFIAKFGYIFLWFITICATSDFLNIIIIYLFKKTLIDWVGKEKISALDEDNALTPHACIVKYPQFMQPLLSHFTLENAIPTCDLFSFFICF